jgi:hypothetical protein
LNGDLALTIWLLPSGACVHHHIGANCRWHANIRSGGHTGICWWHANIRSGGHTGIRSKHARPAILNPITIRVVNIIIHAGFVVVPDSSIPATNTTDAVATATITINAVATTITTVTTVTAAAAES